MSIPDSVISAIGNKIPVIVGPTAIGKTRYSIQLAKQINGEIISIDSRQIYRGFGIGTAQPSNDELKKIPHHLISVLNPDKIISSGQYTDWVNQLIIEIFCSGNQPILVGGSFLYIQSIINGIIQDADSNPEIRRKINDEIKKNGAGSLLSKLRQIDPDYAEIVHPNDIKRLVRALEIYEITGKSPKEVFDRQKQEDYGKQDRFFIIGLTCSRNKLYSRIENRIDEMIRNGWQKEVKKLISTGYDVNSHAMQSLGYKQLVDVEKGLMHLEEAVISIKQKTRQFAKKQITWMKKMTIDLMVEMDFD